VKLVPTAASSRKPAGGRRTDDNVWRTPGSKRVTAERP
jgi:hypothetical protein